MFSFPFKTSRPVREFNGTDYSEHISAHWDRTIFADPIIMADQVTLEMHAEEDIRIGNLVRIPYNLTMRQF